MFTLRANRIAATLQALGLFLIFAVTIQARVADGTIDAGAVISNRAEATYNDETGARYDAVSETVTVTVLSVAAVLVTPDETAASQAVGPHEQITRAFRICNSGNNQDGFTPVRFDLTAPATLVGLYFDNDSNGAVSAGDVPIQLEQTSSPQLAPHDCIGVLAVINTNDAAPQTTLTLRLTARSNATNAVNGRSEDTGTIINAVGAGARLTDPSDSNLAPSKLINGSSQSVISMGATFGYSITFRNSGDTIARNVVLEDQLAGGIEYVPGSLQLNDRSLPDESDNGESSVRNNRVTVRLATINPGEVNRVMFRARLTVAPAAGSGIVNTASFTGDNFAQVKSTVATAVVDPFGLVFAGRSGNSTPIAGAQVEIVTDQNSGNLLALPSDKGFAPNEKNANPFVSDGQGHFSFALASPTETANYFLRVSAQGFINRSMQITLSPTHADLFELKVHALDDQPLAVAGGFDLVREDVNINDLAALVMNIPMFEPSGLQIVKSVDHANAEIGDTVTYRIEVSNPTSASLREVVVHDHLPESFHFAEASGLISLGSGLDQPIVPEYQNGELLFRIGEIPHGATAHLLYRVRIGANARTGEQTNTAVASGIFGSGETTTSATARASVTVSAGVFSTQQIIVGRVFVDTNGNQQFDAADRPMPGVRLYLSNGQSVITDSAGLYNFPSLGDGPQAISLDPVSLPKGYQLSDDGRVSGKSWTRLLRTPVGGGALLRQNFALIDKNKATATTEPAAVSKMAATASPTPANQSASNENLAGQRTYEVAAADNVEAVAAGDVRIVSPAPNSVSMTPGLQVEVRTALNWIIRLEVNGEQISDNNIGVRALDHKNQVSTFTFVGLNVNPGPNKIRCTAIGPDGLAGQTREIVVIGRGPARRLEISSERTEIQSGGNDSTLVHIKAFDQWNNPALDGQLGVETSAGLLFRLNDKQVTEASAKSASLTTPTDSQQRTGGRLLVQLENGEAVLKLIGSGAPGEARIHAETGDVTAEDRIRITSEMRPTILVGFAEMSFGPGIPEVALRNEQGNFRRRLSFFYSGRLPGNSMLTLSYDTQRPINRTAGRDRLFQLDPLDRVYPLFGDSSTRFEAAPSNSKLYARIDHKRSFLMFGDFDTEMTAPLAGYDRKLTGVKAHLENSNGDYVTITGARPDTAFARDVFPAGSLGIIQLSNGEILPGSETITLELRDRRNPDVISSRETLARSIDYNLDASTGRLFLLRYISTFDQGLNLMQLVVTYEHRAASMNSAVYTVRGYKNLKSVGLKLGLSAALQRQPDSADFMLGGVDIEKSLPRHGSLQLAWARSRGEVPGGGNILDGAEDHRHDGDAYRIALDQPLPFFGATVRGRFQMASAGFFNPFGGTVTPGSRRGELAMEMKPLKNSTLLFGVTSERNRTANVDNSRLTFSAAWDQIMNDHIRFHLGFDHRGFNDDLNDKSISSNLVTAAVEVKATDKLEFSVKREQNLGESDPTYPTQTTLGATYRINSLAKLFFTQRLAAAPITPIGDFSGNGFAATTSRRETAIGFETRLGKYSSVTSRYQIENGINGSDSFAVTGLQNRLPLTKELSLEMGFERGFHLQGTNQSFNSATVGFGWQPTSDFRASARYEYRDRGGMGQLFAVGAAGKLSEGITALSRFQFSRGSFGGRSGQSIEGTAALAVRPLNSDRNGLLFSYTHRSLNQSSTATTGTRDRLDSLSTDAYRQVSQRLELYGRAALRLSANGQPELPYVSTLSLLTQARAQYQLTRRLDWAFEGRMLFQPSSKTARSTYAGEVGFWMLPDLRLGGGYNFTSATEPAGSQVLPVRRGFYFTISSKLSNLFDLFGTSKTGLADSSIKPEEKSGH